LIINNVGTLKGSFFGGLFSGGGGGLIVAGGDGKVMRPVPALNCAAFNRSIPGLS
jgi:hypothetical protein